MSIRPSILVRASGWFEHLTGVNPFFNLNRFNVRAAINGDNATLGFSVANGTIGGTITAARLRIDAGAVIAAANTAGPVANRLTITPSGALDIDFRFNATLYGSSLLNGAALPSITIVDNNLFDTTVPTVNANLAPLFLNLSSEAIISGLLNFATWLNNATNSVALNQKIPLLNKTVGQLLATPAEPRKFDRSQIISITSPVASAGFKRFNAQLNLGGKTAASVGIKPNDTMQFLSSGGAFFEGIIDNVAGEVVTIRYDESRTDTPDLSNPALTFQVGGTLGDTIKAALVNFNKPGVVAPALAQLFNELAEPLGIKFNGPGAVSYNNTTRLLTLIPTFTPKPLQYATQLDFGDKVAGLEFNASGNFLVTAAPTIRLPIVIDLNPNPALPAPPIPLGDRVGILDDVTPEISLAITAQLDNPQARASLGFISAILAEDPAVTTNDGVTFNTTLGISIKDPVTASGPAGEPPSQSLLIPPIYRIPLHHPLQVHSISMV